MWSPCIRSTIFVAAFMVQKSGYTTNKLLLFQMFNIFIAAAAAAAESWGCLYLFVVPTSCVVFYIFFTFLLLFLLFFVFDAFFFVAFTAVNTFSNRLLILCVFSFLFFFACRHSNGVASIGKCFSVLQPNRNKMQFFRFSWFFAKRLFLWVLVFFNFCFSSEYVFHVWITHLNDTFCFLHHIVYILRNRRTHC